MDQPNSQRLRLLPGLVLEAARLVAIIKVDKAFENFGHGPILTPEVRRQAERLEEALKPYVQVPEGT